MRRVAPLVLLAFGLLARPASAGRVIEITPSVQKETKEPDDWYPRDITPPPGTHYPCALKALPRDLPGIPAGDKRFINHAFSLILQATQERLKIHNALGGPTPPGTEKAYVEALKRIEDRLQKEPAPQGLETFRDNIVRVLGLQRAFYTKTCELHRGGRPWGELMTVKEGHDASGLLVSSWGLLQRRYQGWPAITSDSIYHHLCALDVF